MEIGEKLKESRTKAGITQEECAEKLGVSRQTVSNWETGRSYPDVRSCLSLGDLYQISLDELLREDTSMIRHLEISTDVVKSKA
ncbi:MAG: helix-turn-helix transcriptional regulator, partial [Clostridia bacterium]|nr:helix-turn-helix transcriptional regulator [Clostridia bacterium]